jgi:vanillate/3-O-methylgallate O-demethylase
VTSESLEAKLARIGDPVRILRDSPSNRFRFDYPDVYTNWQDEQRGWSQTATLFDQSHHMTDVYFEGPDVDRLLAEARTASGPGRPTRPSILSPAPTRAR